MGQVGQASDQQLERSDCQINNLPSISFGHSEIASQGGEDDSDDEEDKKPLRYDKSLPYQLDSNDDGWPILPGRKDLRLSKLKDLIRSFVTMTYRTCKNNY